MTIDEQIIDELYRIDKIFEDYISLPTEEDVTNQEFIILGKEFKIATNDYGTYRLVHKKKSICRYSDSLSNIFYTEKDTRIKSIREYLKEEIEKIENREKKINQIING